MFDHPALTFSWRTALLLVAVLHLLVAAFILLRRNWDPSAYRILSLFLLVIVGVLMPQMIGFAGFYKAWPWLSFAPFDNALAAGPLLLLFTYLLTRGEIPRWILLLLIPAAIELVYQVYWFVQPLERKWAWVADFHDPYIQPVLNAAMIALAAVGVVGSVRQSRRYRAWLDGATSVRAEFDPGWLSKCLWVFIATVLVWAITNALHTFWAPLSYVQEYPAYLFLAASAYAIAQLALIHGREPFPKMPANTAPQTLPGPVHDPSTLADDAEALRRFVREQRLYLEPRLTLGELARRRATNQTDLSRLINQGLGVNFNRFINALRVEEAQQRLRRGNGDILEVALDSGFGSKATFNRVFREITGRSPSEWRRSAIEAAP
jgi:AraC-like DNA-binding protein